MTIEEMDSLMNKLRKAYKTAKRSELPIIRRQAHAMEIALQAAIRKELGE